MPMVRGFRPLGGRVGGFVLLVLPFAASPALANNGLNFIGAGMESFAMGGADIGVSRDPVALSTNPAGLAWQRDREVEQHLAVAHELDVGFHDSLNSGQTVSNQWAPIADGGIAIPLENLPIPVTLSNGVFVQGGSGGAFGSVATPFGTNDELSAKFGIAKVSFGGAAQLSPRWSFGVAGALFYSRLDEKIFPATSSFDAADPAHAFFGTTIRRATSLSAGARLGLQYRASDRLTLGAIYNSKVDLPLEGTHLTLNESAIGLGNVDYRKVRISGLAEPQEAGLGAAYRLTPRLLLALDIKWLDWSDALKSSTLSASNPANPAAVPSVSMTQQLNWRDQYVLAIGAAFDLTPTIVLWAGYNYGNDPVPSATLNPLMATVGEHHLTGGIGWHVAPGWLVGTSLEFQVPDEEPSTNPNLPFGADVHASVGYIALHLGLRVAL